MLGHRSSFQVADIVQAASMDIRLIEKNHFNQVLETERGINAEITVRNCCKNYSVCSELHLS